ncbi:hypothetical protein MJO28_008716 [Puccinia striiformis f. sp. tritici]|uniref:Rnh202 triple barrel domain-containing protein n=2 Tax=Puccinia striiformis TaxID=27350 RepID=A0A2S4W583_9BASI|nr:hypothetical protein MJO28_008716 [Puccinia striiformis f. sp. tritici]KAI7952968.1 hypothetical protein MJO29_008599 [Puccinia striiformis f. sp. tritici]KAI9605427.1 hypothetical protein KEM48_002212 [Puccinia striiformis f. sp. tritici PST-130]POW16899.1 hypothetical protein PSTT_00963 [Puccinia striiformis]
MASDPIILPTCLLEVNEDLPIVRLPHPRTRAAALFAVRAGLGIYEIQSVASPPTSSRSWFFEPISEDQPDQLISKQAGRLLLVTPFDPFFLLLDLFLGHLKSGSDHPNPFEVDSNGHKNKDQRGPHSRFEEIDAILERVQEHWLFSDSDNGRGPSTSDVETFTKEAFKNQHLSRIFAPLTHHHQQQQEGGEENQDNERTLWRVEPDRILNEIKRKVDLLTSVGSKAGQSETRSVWTRLAAKEGVLDFDLQNPDHLPVINDVYKKTALEMVQANLTDSINRYILDQNKQEYNFENLKKAKDKLTRQSTTTTIMNPSELIGRKTTTTTSNAPPPAKRKKKDNEDLKPKPKITLHSYFKPKPT